jgi:hypothetical protein
MLDASDEKPREIKEAPPSEMRGIKPSSRPKAAAWANLNGASQMRAKSLCRAMFLVDGFLGPLKWTEIGWVILAVDTDDL